MVVRALLGDYRVSFPDAIRIIGGEQIPGASFVLMESTLPRALMAVLAGAAFGAAGCAFQVMLRNPLASPDVLGITLGASAGAVIAVVVLGVRGTPVTVAALTGAVLAAGLILSQAGGRGGATGRMVLIGVALAAGLSAVVHWVLVRASIYQAQDALVWLSGSLNTVTWPEILRMLVLDAMLLPLLLVLAGRLPVLGLGDDLASGLGVRVGGLRVGVTVVVVTLVAAATAVVGPIAFVGFLSGPIARRLVPADRPSVSPPSSARSSSSPPTTSPRTASPAPPFPSASSPAARRPGAALDAPFPTHDPGGPMTVTERRAEGRDRPPAPDGSRPRAADVASPTTAASSSTVSPWRAHGPDHGRRRAQRVRQVDPAARPGPAAAPPRGHGAPRRGGDRLAPHP